MGETWRIIIGLIIAGIGGVIAGSVLVDLRTAKRSAAWPQVKGKVLTSRVSRREGSYSVRLEYEYAVDGVQYTSDRIKFGATVTVGSGKEEANAITERYPVGSEVTVYYDPHKPSRSVLEREVEARANFIDVLFAVLLVGIGTYVLSGLFSELMRDPDFWKDPAK